MARQDSQVRWVVRPVVVCMMLLVSLDLLLVGLAVLNRPAPPALTRRFAADRQADALDARADRARQRYGEFRQRFDARAAATRPEPAPQRVDLKKGLGKVSDEQRPRERERQRQR